MTDVPPTEPLLAGLPFDLAITGLAELGRAGCPRPTHACSILDPGAPVPFRLQGLDRTRRLDLRLHDTVDALTATTAPDDGHVGELLAFGRCIHSCGVTRPRLLVHCELGLSRSTAVALILVAQALPSLTAREVAGVVLQARADAWPNLRLVALGDRMLGRRGTLVIATRCLLDRQARRNPALARYMEHDGLGRYALQDGTLMPRGLLTS